MKGFIIIWISMMTLMSLADNLTAKDGAVYRNVTIISADPEQMLIVHDGGGCQVAFKDLVPDSLTPTQREVLEKELRYYVERSDRLEKIRADREAFENARREKGLVEFEGGWVTPLEREEILLSREERRLELERKRVQLAKEKEELEKEKLQTETARYLLEGETRGSTTFYYGYSRPYRNDCIPSLPCRHNYHCARHSSYRSSGTTIIYGEQNNPYISFDSAASYNRGPFHR